MLAIKVCIYGGDFSALEGCQWKYCDIIQATATAPVCRYYSSPYLYYAGWWQIQCSVQAQAMPMQIRTRMVCFCFIFNLQSSSISGKGVCSAPRPGCSCTCVELGLIERPICSPFRNQKSKKRLKVVSGQFSFIEGGRKDFTRLFSWSDWGVRITLDLS